MHDILSHDVDHAGLACADARSQREREVPVDAAIGRAMELCRSSGFDVRIEPVAVTADDKGPDFRIVSCVMSESDRVVARGSGKGLAAQSTASALFEALENYYMLRRNRAWEPAPDVAPVSVLVTDVELSIDRLYTMMHDWQPSGNIATFPYGSAHASTADVPVALGDVGYRDYSHPGDDFDYRPFNKYFSTNGIASGSTINEAVVHGLLELLERDAVSRALLGVAGIARPTARRVDFGSLPQDLSNVVQQIVERSGIAPTLYMLETLGGATTFYAVVRRDEGTFSFTGAGCSIWPDYAVERAINELWQSISMTSALNLWTKTRHAFDRLSRYEPLLRTMKPRPVDLCADPATTVPIDAARDPEEPASPGTVLDRITAQLDQEGFACFWRPLLDAEVKVVHVYVPGLERFMLVTQGNPLLPTGADVPRRAD
ncbi:MAG: YcaO-like family protein [Acidimicrobiales bacterium]